MHAVIDLVEDLVVILVKISVSIGNMLWSLGRSWGHYNVLVLTRIPIPSVACSRRVKRLCQLYMEITSRD